MLPIVCGIPRGTQRWKWKSNEGGEGGKSNTKSQICTCSFPSAIHPPPPRVPFGVPTAFPGWSDPGNGTGSTAGHSLTFLQPPARHNRWTTPRLWLEAAAGTLTKFVCSSQTAQITCWSINKCKCVHGLLRLEKPFKVPKSNQQQHIQHHVLKHHIHEVFNTSRMSISLGSLC